MDELPARGLALAEGLRDLVVPRVEDVAQETRRAGAASHARRRAHPRREGGARGTTFTRRRPRTAARRVSNSLSRAAACALRGRAGAASSSAAARDRAAGARAATDPIVGAADVHVRGHRAAEGEHMQRTTSTLFVLAVLVLGAAPAAAVAEDGEAGGDRLSSRGSGLLTPVGEYVLVGGGVSNFFDRSVRDRVDLAGLWELRFGLGSRSFLGAEAAYVGSARSAGSLAANLVTSGVEGVVRAQIPWEAGRWLVEPFAFGGAGWTSFHLHSASPGQPTSDDLFVVPVGAGLTVARDHLLLDARFTYRQTFDEGLLRAADGSAASLKSWAVAASVGYEF
jgi:hypothetical protein